MYDSAKFAAQVVFDPGGAGEFVFDTAFGGFGLASETQTTDVMVDKYGTTPYDKIVSGTIATITMPITLPNGATLEQFAGVTKDVDEYAITGFGGLSLRASAKPVYIKPIENGTVNTDQKKWYHVPMGTKPVLNYSGVYVSDGDQEIFNCTIFGLVPDDPTFEGKPVVLGVNTGP